ncbi:hypothetical protein [Tsuneonella amylolytica]|uniref:hypothetical protein n=1 Tax=Tsuneonella amylolytica TaxID=2338327 RepID=UPI000EA96259|nr:hypothetical protein [Tsuneonella amylolytica]
MSAGLSRHFLPAVAGALVSFAVRLAVGDLEIALVGVVVFFAIYAVLALLTRAMNKPAAPTAFAVISAVATTVAFLVSHSS